MSEKRQTWKNYIAETAGKKHESYKTLARLDMRPVSLSALAKGVFAAYTKDSKREEFLKKDSVLPWYKAISPLKLLNPFLLLNTMSNLVQVGIAFGIDSMFPKNTTDGQKGRAHPVAKVLKRGALSPFAYFSAGTALVANIQRAPVIQNRFKKKKPVSTNAMLFSSFNINTTDALSTESKKLECKEFVMPKDITHPKEVAMKTFEVPRDLLPTPEEVASYQSYKPGK